MSRFYQLRSTGKPGGLVPSADAVANHKEHKEHREHREAPAAVVRFAAGLPAAFMPGETTVKAYGVPAVPAGRKGGTALSQNQKASIGSLAGEAFARAVAADPEWLPDMKAQGFTKSAVMEDWRHSQCKLATKDHPAGQVTGLSKAGNEHYNCLLAHFAALAGQDVRSFNATMSEGTGTGGGDSADKMRQALWRLERTMKETGLGMGYVIAIVKRKHHKTHPDQLTAGQIGQLCWTLKNRKNQKRHDAGEVIADGSSRNKAQTAARKTPRQELPENVLPFEPRD